MKGLYRRALKSKLLTPNILWTCADIWTTKDRDKTFGEYKKFFSGKNFNSQDEILQHHCMFEFYERMGNYKKALDELQQANRKKNRINSFDFESFKKILDDTLCHVNRETYSHQTVVKQGPSRFSLLVCRDLVQH